MDETWEVYALKYAERAGRTRSDSFIMDDDHAAPHPIDYFIWLLRSPAGTIVVDTGFDAAEAARRGRPLQREPADALAALGVDAATVDTVIVTHLHYDHAGSLERFPNATFHLQAAEMAYVTGPCMAHPHLRMPFSPEHVCQMVRRLFEGRVHFHDGEAAVAPGVTVHRIGGHTQGLQVVRVKTAAGWLCLASDASHFYENFLAGKPFPIVLDLQGMLEGFRRIQALASAPSLVIPGHDPLVLRHFAAPEKGMDFVRRLDQGPRRPLAPAELMGEG